VTAFEDFIELQQRVPPTTLQLGETRIARALAAIRPVIAVPADVAKLHRCHLATAWCARRGMPAAWSQRALVCGGVRAALALIFGELRGERIAIPRDVYPVYWQLAEHAGVSAIAIDTFPEPRLTDARYLVLPCPFKLHGRAWTAAEFAAVRHWLATDPSRRLILDGVYSFDATLAPDVIALIETDQVIYLDSLSKSWLHERVFGTAVVPTQDQARWAPVFRAAAPSQAALFTARALLEAPVAVAAELALRRTRTLAALAARDLTPAAPSRGYFIPIEIDARLALERHDVLLIPFAVFGGTAAWSFASAL
jgi:histidinol-phosphate/aromatic aminotransferase/cobyric acid decarboxylase-like protein